MASTQHLDIAYSTLNKESSESIKLCINVLKLGKRNKTKQILVLTENAIYAIKPKNNSIQRRINLLDIASITTSYTSTECTINIPSEYDYQFDSINASLQNEIISMISQQIIQLNHTIFINKIKNDSTTSWTITPQKLKKVNSHWNQTVRTVIAIDYLTNMGFRHSIVHKAWKQNKQNLSLTTQYLIKDFVKNAKNGSRKIGKSPLVSVTEVNTNSRVTYSSATYQPHSAKLSPTPSSTQEINDTYALIDD